jgi:hypothetical protein
MRIAENFHASYIGLEVRMKALAEADRDVFLPVPEPEGPADFILIGMEPSLGWWARSADAGFRNFLFSIEDFIRTLRSTLSLQGWRAIPYYRPVEGSNARRRWVA